MPVIGSQRPYRLAKYLPRFGWKPTVLTIDHKGDFPQGIEVHPTNYTDRIALIKRIAGFSNGTGIHQQIGIVLAKNFRYNSLKSKTIKAIKEIVAFPDEEIGWLRHAVAAASLLITKTKIDAIISTSFPATTHLIAQKLKRKYGIPWIADLRDLWTQNHYYGKFWPVKYLERQMELKTLSGADALVAISEPLADELKGMHAGKKIVCITNGFDPEDFHKDPALSKKFTITYTGRLYNGKRDPSVLFRAVAELIARGIIDRTQIEINFYGPDEPWLAADVEKSGLNDIVHIRGNVSRDLAIKMQQQSQLLLLLLWNEEKEKGVYTGKLFEYLGSRRPIIAFGCACSIVKGLLASTDAGMFAENQEQMESIIMKYYQEFSKSGFIKFKGNNSIENYSYYSIALQYSDLLNSAISKSKGQEGNA
ncbi:MAG: glycosyltransferase [Nitrospiraceae bacterium]|nr:glycosyltransferase [Nitrospiraceae bacterium]